MKKTGNQIDLLGSCGGATSSILMQMRKCTSFTHTCLYCVCPFHVCMQQNTNNKLYVCFAFASRNDDDEMFAVYLRCSFARMELHAMMKTNKSCIQGGSIRHQFFVFSACCTAISMFRSVFFFFRIKYSIAFFSVLCSLVCLWCFFLHWRSRHRF